MNVSDKVKTIHGDGEIIKIHHDSYRQPIYHVRMDNGQEILFRENELQLKEIKINRQIEDLMDLAPCMPEALVQRILDKLSPNTPDSFTDKSFRELIKHLCMAARTVKLAKLVSA